MSSVSFITTTQQPLSIASGKSASQLPLSKTSSGTLPASDTVIISQAARDANSTLAANASTSTANTTDTKLAEIKAKVPSTLTAEEVDYMQKAGKAEGAGNSFALLSTEEKELYNKAVASGNTQAAAGISIIAFERTLGHSAGGAPGTTYDPLNTAITADNVKNYFSYSVIDPSGKMQSQFQALIQFLQNNPTASS